MFKQLSIDAAFLAFDNARETYEVARFVSGGNSYELVHIIDGKGDECAIIMQHGPLDECVIVEDTNDIFKRENAKGAFVALLDDVLTLQVASIGFASQIMCDAVSAYRK